MGLIGRLGAGLRKTREGLGSRIGYLFRSRGDERGFFDELEEILVSSDVGVETSLKLTEAFRTVCRENNVFGSGTLASSFRDFLVKWMDAGTVILDPSRFTVMMLLGVNGSGKTTTTGKLAAGFMAEGKKVMLAAADTYRAAAIEQLEVWANRVGAPLIRQNQGSDPGAVVFDALSAAKARNHDILIADTAGRFHNRENLVRELQKINKIIANKTGEGDRYMKLAVLDATAGSNAYEQARAFHDAVGLDGVILTKMDSSARGGVAIAIAGTLKLPIWKVGIGEKVEDLVDFHPEEFVDALIVR